MSAITKAALDDAIRAHVADEQDGALTPAWLVVAGTTNRSADVIWDGPEDQPGFATIGLAHMLVGLTAGFEDR